MVAAGADASHIYALSRNMRTITAGAQGKVKRAMAKTLADIEKDAKAIIVVKDIIDTGNLLNSVSHEIDADGMGGEVGPTAEYGIYQELGTSTQPARPYLGPAFDRRCPGLDKALAQIADGLGNFY